MPWIQIILADINFKKKTSQHPPILVLPNILYSQATKPKPTQYITTAHNEHKSTQKIIVSKLFNKKYLEPNYTKKPCLINENPPSLIKQTFLKNLSKKKAKP